MRKVVCRPMGPIQFDRSKREISICFLLSNVAFRTACTLTMTKDVD